MCRNVPASVERPERVRGRSARNWCAACCAFGSVAVSLLPVSDGAAQRTPRTEAPFARKVSVIPTFERPTTQLVALVITSSSCAYAASDSFRIELVHVLNALRAYAPQQMQNGEVLLAGVSIDHDPEVGLAALRKLGPFDEISVGGSWLNSQIVRFGLRDFPHRVGTPSLVLFKRTVTTHKKSIDVGPDSIVARADGIESIKQLRFRLINRTGEFSQARVAVRLVHTRERP